jgi:hypothetical protein
MPDGHYEVELTQGYHAKVDLEDAEWAVSHLWHAMRVVRSGREWVYACRKPGIYLHREIAKRMGMSASALVDHRDGDTLNDRRYNLREADHSLNGLNTKRSTGVCFARQQGKFKAYIWSGGKFRHLGYFATEEEARAARSAAEEELGL